jgi:hypothetical protein
MPKDPKHDKQVEDERMIREIEKIKGGLGITHTPAYSVPTPAVLPGMEVPTPSMPGASDQELWPAQPAEQFTDFRLAGNKKRKSRGGNYA